jgi:hypothetical protein
MIGSEHYLLGSRREAVTHYIFRQLLSVEDVMIALGSVPYGDSSTYYADAEDAELIKALRSGRVKAAASNGSERRLLPPAFWKILGGALKAFTEGTIGTPAGIDMPGLRDVQGWRVVFDEASFEGWRNKHAHQEPNISTPADTKKHGKGKGRPRGSGGYNDDADLEKIQRMVDEENLPVSKACEVRAVDKGIKDENEIKAFVDRLRRKHRRKNSASSS